MVELALIPFITFLIPTYNAERTIKACLDSIFHQDYSRDRFEVIVIDGGSSDRTLDIIREYSVKIIFNKKPPPYNQEGRDGGKALGLGAAKGELIAFIDADNVLSNNDWLKKMVQPFIEDLEIVACETSRFANRKDSAINRYCSALVTKTPRKDPFIIFRSGATRIKIEKRRDTITYRTDITNAPCLANGTIIRKEILLKAGGYDYDWDTCIRIVNMGYNKFSIVINTGIYHYYVRSFSELIRKGVWRIRYLIYSLSDRKTELFPHYIIKDKQRKLALLLDLASGFTLISTVAYAIQKFKEERDYAWMYHPIVYFIVPLIYIVVLFTSQRGISFLFAAISSRVPKMNQKH